MHAELRKRIRRLLTALGWLTVVVAFVSKPASAGSTKHWLLDTAEELAAGDLEGTVVHTWGGVGVGRSTERFTIPDVGVARCVATDAEGRVFIGTGNDGKIYRMEPRKGPKLFAETEQLLVSALAFGADGTLYAGTLPEGRIYAVDRDGVVRLFSRPEGAEHIWDLVYDLRRRTLYAATGPKGSVFAIRPDGRAIVRYEGSDAHVMSLALASDGSLYAGTSDRSLLLRLPVEGETEVVRDFEADEITALDERNGHLVVASNTFPEPPSAPSAQRNKVNGGQSTSPARAAPPRPKTGRGELWRVESDGRAERVYTYDEGHFASVQLGAEGEIYAAVGAEGRVVRVDPERGASVWFDAEERQVLDLDLLHSEGVIVTGDPAAVYRVEPGPADSPVWISKPLDAEFRSRWGTLHWQGRGRFEFETRSGNTSEPDDTWTAWSTSQQDPGPVRSPGARFLQVRARFIDRTPEAALWSVGVYYLPENQRPVVHSVRRVETKKDDKGADSVRKASPVLSLEWSARNPDGDPLRFRLWFRQQGQSVWRPMFEESTVLMKTRYDWDTRSVPDGLYIVRVDASDSPSNPEALALDSRAQSEPLLVDHHTPTIRGLRYRRGVVSGVATDRMGPIARLEYAIDGGPWQVLFPVDDVFDSPTERFRFRPQVESGSHVFAVRCFDAAGNIGSDEIVAGAPN